MGEVFAVEERFELSFGGAGREGGAEGILEYLSVKYTMTPNPFA